VNLGEASSPFPIINSSNKSNLIEEAKSIADQNKFGDV